ncbi:MAG: DUF898 family protein [Acholeplasma sp.]|jgi:uncharacterized membrane protein YjgN (DUF898 family)|nr:DUF898 family protein [Acholeplasma sp.]
MNNSKFTGGLLGLIGIAILSGIIVLFTLGICLPYAVVIRQRWIAEHTYIEGKQLKFVGTGISLFGQWIKWLLLCIITLGIYSLWVNIKMKQWVVQNTCFA